MSLYKQLCLSIVFLMFMAFIGSFYVGLMSSKEYIEEQLYRKNIDNASSLALSLSSKEMDKITTELFISAQFDTGHYQYIQIELINGISLFRQNNKDEISDVPEWLISIFPMNIGPGIAKITNGWNQIGTLSLESDKQFAYIQLWDISKKLLYYFITVSIVSMVFGGFLLRFITKPLNSAVLQAKAIGERRFISSPEPKTREFRDLIRSMNKLSAHVKSMLDDESNKLENWRKEIQIDDITGLLKREPVLNKLHSFLQSENENSDGSIFIIRIFDLIKLNQSKGRKTMDAMLGRFGSYINTICMSKINATSGRLTGSDLILILPREQSPMRLAKEMLENLNRNSLEIGLDSISVIISCTTFHHGDSTDGLLNRIESVLNVDPHEILESCIYLPSESMECYEPVQWENVLNQALIEKHFILDAFPVLDPHGDILHWEAPVRLINQDGTLITAGHFMPHISRLGWGAKLDMVVMELAIKKISDTGMSLGINISSDLLLDIEKMVKLSEFLKNNKQEAEKLWVELPECGVFQHIDAFRLFCHYIKPWVSAIGIEHVSREVTRIGELHDLGLAYIKIDHSMIRNIDTITASQVFLRGFCMIIHSIGLKAIAEGVKTEQEWKSLCDLGFDGGTGVYFPKE